MIVDGPLRVGGTLRAIWRETVLLFAWAVIVTVALVGFNLRGLVPSDVPLPLLGTGLVVFLGLRNNAAYARWWEARTLWGGIVNTSRNLARTLNTLLPGPEGAPLRNGMIAHQIAWTAALRQTLRQEDARSSLVDTLPAETVTRLADVANVPFGLQREIGDLLGEALRSGQIDSMQFVTVNALLNTLTDGQGGLERIRNTPMPHHYATLPHVFVLIYGVLLPFGVVNDLGWLTPVACLLISVLFLTLDRAGANLEKPFARSIHDVPMTAICRTIEIDLKQANGHSDRPSPVRAVRGVLR